MLWCCQLGVLTWLGFGRAGGPGKRELAGWGTDCVAFCVNLLEKVLVITQDGRTIVVRVSHPPRSAAQLQPRSLLNPPTPPRQPANRIAPSDPQGKLEGFDQTINVILSESLERVYSLEEEVEEVPLGLYVVRGDNIVSQPSPHSTRARPANILTLSLLTCGMVGWSGCDWRDGCRARGAGGLDNDPSRPAPGIGPLAGHVAQHASEHRSNRLFSSSRVGLIVLVCGPTKRPTRLDGTEAQARQRGGGGQCQWRWQRRQGQLRVYFVIGHSRPPNTNSVLD